MALSARTVYAGNTGSTLGVLVDPGSTGDMQLVKLAVGSIGSEALVPGDATYGLSVDITRIGDDIVVTDGGSSLTVDDGGDSLTVDGEVSISGSVTVDTELAAAAALADSTANPTIPSVGALGLVFNGTTWDRARGDTTYGWDVDVTRMPAAARTTDSIAAALQTDAIMNGLTALTPAFAVIDAASSGDNTLIAAAASKVTRVHAVFLVAAAAVTVRFESGASGTALTGQMNVAANSGFVLPFNPLGWFQTGTNTLLNLELSGATSVDGCIVYSQPAA